MKKIIERSPTRIDLAGGTLDCWPLYSFFGTCYTINVAIDIYTQANLTLRNDKKIILEIKDLDFSYEFSNLDEVLNCEFKETALHRAVLDYLKPDYGFELSTQSQSPIGGGLGGSSSLLMSILKAFFKLIDRPFILDEMLTVALNIESFLLKAPSGTQDYIPPVTQCLNIITYTQQGPKIEALDLELSSFFERAFLIYSGKPHHSGLNNWDVIKACVEGNKQTIQALEKIRDISHLAVEVCRQEDWASLGSIFQQELEARKALSKSFVTPELEQLSDLVIGLGAEAVKVCGAGGGGCVMVWTKAGQKEDIIQSCKGSGCQVLEVSQAQKN